jgi:hypothetical protein
LIGLLVIDKPSLQLVGALERIAGGSLFDLGPNLDHENLQEFAAQFLSQAETLRIGGTFEQSGKESDNV